MKLSADVAISALVPVPHRGARRPAAAAWQLQRSTSSLPLGAKLTYHKRQATNFTSYNLDKNLYHEDNDVLRGF